MKRLGGVKLSIHLTGAPKVKLWGKTVLDGQCTIWVPSGPHIWCTLMLNISSYYAWRDPGVLVWA